MARITTSVDDAEFWSSVGTPLYMSPQVFEHSKFSSKCDIWSLAILVYELLYGLTPWFAQNPTILLKNIKNEPLKFPQKPCRSDDIKELISQMLVIDEKHRINWAGIYEHKLIKIDKVFKFFSLYNIIYIFLLLLFNLSFLIK